MATSTSIATDATAPPRTRRRILPGIVLALLLLALGAVGYLYHVARSALPQLDGIIRVSALTAPVTVNRDPHGVPDIEAATLEDLFFAQGYVTAQDRLWQMDVMRRFAAGEMSELLGPALLEHDREQRILGLRAAAQRQAAALTPRDRAYFEAYARGVNSFLNSHFDRLPIEFRLIGYKPQPWQVEDSLLLGARMVQDLNHGTYKSALVREKVLARLGPDLTNDLFVNTSWRDHPPSGTGRRIDDEERPSRNQKDEDDDDDEMDSGADSNVAGLLPQALTHISTEGRATLVPGSNNWVVSGEHTVSGKPLLSNDMHLGHQMPNLWYEAHLHSGEYDVIGVTLPGVPFVIVGHNRRVSWGFTNVGPTVEDLYVEIVNEQGAYQTPKGWQPLEHREEVIHVKGQPDVTVDVALTRHGPIITDLIPGETRKIALRWTLYDSLHNPFFEINSAQNWDEFQKAFAELPAPGQNVVYADVDGHIGYHATGHVPIRTAGDGSLPVSGADDQHEWKGYIPFDKLPSVYDPPSGILATANSRISPDKYPYSISTEWDPPWRTDRIYQVLESGRKFSAADMLSLQTDVFSAFDRFCAERFVYALDHVKNLSPRAQQARDLMRDWDGRLSIDSPAATIENRAQYELRRLLLEPKLGPAPKPASDKPHSDEDVFSWKSYRWFSSSLWLENVLAKQPPRWLPNGYPSYEALLAAAVDAAVNNPEAPKDLTQWRWGAFAPIDIEHPVLNRLPLIGRWTGPGLRDQSGGSLTIKQVGRTFGPSERYTADLADLDQSTLNTVTGQGGNFLSPYYMDQWNAWYEGTTFALPFSSQAVDKAKQHRLVLEPRKQVSGLRSQVSGLRSQVSGLRSQVSGLNKASIVRAD
ncbi:MAG TPA: penicillin acylase family protein [Terriglobales bacterium]|nr:penicillin acylase family protein [Terriglobales bacterium]